MKFFYFHIKVYIVTYQTCQNFTRIINLQVSFYLVKVGFLPTLQHDSGLYFLQPVVVYSLLFDNSRLDQSQQSELSTYFVLSTDCKPEVLTFIFTAVQSSHSSVQNSMQLLSVCLYLSISHVCLYPSLPSSVILSTCSRFCCLLFFNTFSLIKRRSLHTFDRLSAKPANEKQQREGEKKRTSGKREKGRG